MPNLSLLRLFGKCNFYSSLTLFCLFHSCYYAVQRKYVVGVVVEGEEEEVVDVDDVDDEKGETGEPFILC